MEVLEAAGSTSGCRVQEHGWKPLEFDENQWV